MLLQLPYSHFRLSLPDGFLCLPVACHITKCKRASKLLVIWLNPQIIGDICMGNYDLFKSTLFALLFFSVSLKPITEKLIGLFWFLRSFGTSEHIPLHNFLKVKPKQNNERNSLWNFCISHLQNFCSMLVSGESSRNSHSYSSVPWRPN